MNMILFNYVLLGVFIVVLVYFLSRVQAKAWAHEFENQLDKYINSKLKLKKEQNGKKENEFL